MCMRARYSSSHKIPLYLIHISSFQLALTCVCEMNSHFLFYSFHKTFRVSLNFDTYYLCGLVIIQRLNSLFRGEERKLMDSMNFHKGWLQYKVNFYIPFEEARALAFLRIPLSYMLQVYHLIFLFYFFLRSSHYSMLSLSISYYSLRYFYRLKKYDLTIPNEKCRCIKATVGFVPPTVNFHYIYCDIL